VGETKHIRLKTVRLNNDWDTITLLDERAKQVDQVSYSAKDAKKEGWSIISWRARIQFGTIKESEFISCNRELHTSLIDRASLDVL
jgi:hypothetical protein